MAYTINLTDGTIFAVIADGTINTDSSMTLVGKNYAGYGEFLDENFIHLLENGSNTTQPGDPLVGQLWWDKTNGIMKVYNGTTFKVICSATASASAPGSNVTGDLWFDTVNAQLKVYNGSSFILVGPAFTSGTGTSGAIVDTITDSSPGSDHVVVKMFVNNTIVAIFSKDATFTPAAALTGFATIGPGLNMSTDYPTMKGTATNADLLDSLNSTQFMRSDTNTSTTGTLSVLNDTGLYVGGDSDARLFVTGTDVYLRNQTLDGDIYIQVNDGGSTVSPIVIDGATGNVTCTFGLTVGGNISATGGTVSFGTASVSLGSIINNNANGVGNIGTSGGYFNTIFAKATSAEYADLAERFEADAAYAPGTVVMLGGAKEITAVVEDATDEVFGVISTRPAYTMNGAAGDDATHPPIAMTGRVPVRVIGPVRKGDRLVSAGNGLARSAGRDEWTAYNVIGRALKNKETDGEGTVEAIVTIN
jgi:hypothetical protein